MLIVASHSNLVLLHSVIKYMRQKLANGIFQRNDENKKEQ